MRDDQRETGLMECDQSICLRAPVADCLPTSSLDTHQLSLLSGINTPAKSCANEPQTDGSPDCGCTRETLGCSIHPNTPESWTASMQASLVRILALPENRQGLERKRAVASTVKSSASLAWFDPATCSLRMSQQSFLTDSELSSPILSRSGMTRNGYVYELPTVGRTIRGTDGGYWPTPMTRDRHAQGPSALNGKSQVMLSTMIEKMWPTPTVNGNHNRKGLSPTSGDGLATAAKMWPTPHANCHTGAGKRGAGGINLQSAAKMWPTPNSAGREKQRRAITDDAEHETAERGGWWEAEPDVGRISDGVSARIHRLKALGNAQVPLQAAVAWRLLGGE